MALSPQAIRQTTFKTSRKGYDPDEVSTFLADVAAALESAQNDATAMEARARAAVARLQELTQQAGGDAGGAQPAPVRVAVDESETISRTLLLAQRTADTTVADAQAEADRLLTAARDDANASLDAARAEVAELIDEAKADARRAGESERVQVEGEVQALLARRDFLESDVDHLEQYLVAQRERIVEAVAALNDIVHRVPDGLADMRRPLLSAAAASPTPRAVASAEVDDSDGDDDAEERDDEIVEAELVVDDDDEIAEITRIAGAGGEAHDDGARDATPSGALFADEPTQQFSAVNPRDAGGG